MAALPRSDESSTESRNGEQPSKVTLLQQQLANAKAANKDLHSIIKEQQATIDELQVRCTWSQQTIALAGLL